MDAGDTGPIIGPIRYALRVPALGAADYGRMQGILLRAGATPAARGRLIASLVAGAGLGGLLGFLSSSLELEAELWVVSGRDGWAWHLGGAGVALLGLLLVLLTALALVAWFHVRQRGALRRLHAAGGDVFGEHDLLLGEDGLLWRNAVRAVATPWSRITGTARQGGMVYLLADRISAFWLPEALLTGHPDRAGIEALLRRHAGPGPDGR